MIRLFRLTAGLIGICVILIIATRLIGAARPNPIVGWFTNPDGTPCQMPCVFGVRPGATTFDEALVILRAHPITANAKEVVNVHRDSFDTRELITPDFMISLYRRDADGNFSISVIHNDKSTAMPSLGTVLSTLGLPTNVDVGGYGDYAATYFSYFKSHLRVIVDGFDKPCYISVASHYIMITITSVPFPEYSVLWRGFANRLIYFREYLSQFPDQRSGYRFVCKR